MLQLDDGKDRDRDRHVVDVNSTTRWGETPLMLVVKTERYKAAESLLRSPRIGAEQKDRAVNSAVCSMVFFLVPDDRE